MQKGNVLIFLLLIVGIFVVAAITGAFYYVSHKVVYLGNDVQLTPTITLETPRPSLTPMTTSQTPQSTPTSSLIPDETTNWKTYTNTKYRFSFNYPPSANLTEYDIDNSVPNLLYTVYIDLKNSSIDVQSPLLQSIRVWGNLGVNIDNSESRDKWCNLLQSSLTGQLDCNFDSKLPDLNS